MANPAATSIDVTLMSVHPEEEPSSFPRACDTSVGLLTAYSGRTGPLITCQRTRQSAITARRRATTVAVSRQRSLFLRRRSVATATSVVLSGVSVAVAIVCSFRSRAGRVMAGTCWSSRSW